ncbi:MAG TPA: peroxiredoxin [Aggregatilineales bacterium]|nr:peroxiredoxin [Anaerolineales bacterium]HRE49761.1 peroxiredoxin [Aggregatilineales bacterium]
MPQIGEIAPDFELLNQDGSPVKLSDFRGKNVVLYFYPEDFTSGCEYQACKFRDGYEAIHAENAVVVGISPDTPERHTEFRQVLNLPFTLLCDPDLSLTKAWGVYGKKTYSNGVEYEGLIRSQYILDGEGRIVAANVPVKAPDSYPLALEALKTIK